MRPNWRIVFVSLLLLFGLAISAQAQPIPSEPPVILDRGALITFVRPDSPAQEAGLEAGDVIVSVNGVVITSVQHLERALRLSMVARLEVIRRVDGRRLWVLATPRDGELGIFVRMVDPLEMPFLPPYRRVI